METKHHKKNDKHRTTRALKYRLRYRKYKQAIKLVSKNLWLKINNDKFCLTNDRYLNKLESLTAWTTYQTEAYTYLVYYTGETSKFTALVTAYYIIIEFSSCFSYQNRSYLTGETSTW